MTTPSAPTPFGSKIDTDLAGKGDDKKAEDNDPRQGLPDTVKVSEGNQPLELDTEKRVDPKGRYIQYNGVGTVRDMGPAEWEAANVESENIYQWNYFNKKRIPLSAFTDDELTYLLRIDDRFSIVELDSEGNLVEQKAEDA